MFIPNKSLILHIRCHNYLVLIRKANFLYKSSNQRLEQYDACKDIFQPIRVMNKRIDFEINIMRYQTLSNWLAFRYSNVLTELVKENQEQLNNLIKSIETTLSTNELKQSQCVITNPNLPY